MIRVERRFNTRCSLKFSICLLLFLNLNFQGSFSLQRPIWNLGHMVNSVKQVRSFLDDGANGLESDVSFNKRGGPQYTYHGVPCDCFRDCLRWEYFTTFLDYISEISTPGTLTYRSTYNLQFLDLKISSFSRSVKESAVKELSLKLIDHFYKNGTRNPTLRFVLNLPTSEDVGLVTIIRNTFEQAGLGHFTQNIGYEVYSYESLGTIKDKWEKTNASANVWQGDGITNCLPRSSTRLIQAVQLRDSNGDSYMNKVYYWTVDKQSTMRYTLDLDVDGILTNHPARMRDLLSENGMSKRFRLATYDDNPFQTVKAKPKPYAKMLIPKMMVNVDENDIQEKILFNPLPKPV